MYGEGEIKTLPAEGSIYIQTYESIHIYIHRYESIHVNTYICVYICIYMRTYIWIYAYIYLLVHERGQEIKTLPAEGTHTHTHHKHAHTSHTHTRTGDLDASSRRVHGVGQDCKCHLPPLSPPRSFCLTLFLSHALWLSFAKQDLQDLYNE